MLTQDLDNLYGDDRNLQIPMPSAAAFLVTIHNRQMPDRQAQAMLEELRRAH
jgi:hypothetical protein